MGSRIMHLAVAKAVSQQLNIPYEPFAFGNLIVDAHKDLVEKKISHYTIPGATFHSANILDEEKFKRQYQDMSHHPVYLGYYSHLITDHIWLKEVYATTMVNGDGSIKNHLTEDYYQDYGILNPLLIERYGLTQAGEAFDHAIEAVNPHIVPEILEGLHRDFRQEAKGQLKVMDLDVIHEFIRKSTQAVIKRLEVWLETGQ